MHLPIEINKFELIIAGRTLINDFSTVIYPGAKIGIIGDNGSGKSSLIKAIFSAQTTKNPAITFSQETVVTQVPQLLIHDTLSGGERFNAALSVALVSYPDILLLDEPTNHLDVCNRQSLFKLLRHNPATMLIVSHDRQLLDNYVDCLWHIHDGQVTIFNGNYSDYLCELAQRRDKLYRQIDELKAEQKQQHLALMKEQLRAKNSRQQGEKHIEQRKWPTITSGTKARRAQTTAGKNSSKIRQSRQEIVAKLDNLWQPEELRYSFSLDGFSSDKAVVTISGGSCGYHAGGFSLNDININLAGKAHLALCGNNGSGKTTLIKAILGESSLWRHGEWQLPASSDIAYLDQHYAAISSDATVMEMVSRANPQLSHSELRNFLNQFLFRKNEEVAKTGAVLSGGEKVRLSLALIALRIPKLLIIDEISNNIDLTTREHIIQILQNYPGALIIISHDSDFVNQLNIDEFYYL